MPYLRSGISAKPWLTVQQSSSFQTQPPASTRCFLALLSPVVVSFMEFASCIIEGVLNSVSINSLPKYQVGRKHFLRCSLLILIPTWQPECKWASSPVFTWVPRYLSSLSVLPSRQIETHIISNTIWRQVLFHGWRFVILFWSVLPTGKVYMRDDSRNYPWSITGRRCLSPARWHWAVAACPLIFKNGSHDTPGKCSPHSIGFSCSIWDKIGLYARWMPIVVPRYYFTTQPTIQFYSLHHTYDGCATQYLQLRE